MGLPRHRLSRISFGLAIGAPNECPVNMWRSQLWILSAILLSAASLHASQPPKNSIKSSVFLSPPFFLQPGSVANKFYYDILFPRGHIAIKSFNAEVVDEMGVPVPLHETYLHHWVVERYYSMKGTQVGPNSSKFILARNAGICKNTLGQYYGLGSETRRTATWVPGPYGIEVGNPKEIPNGYEEKWLLNVHAIDTRAVEDRLGCTECKCSLYNVTIDEFGHHLGKDYIGGLYCCYDQTQCRLKEGINGGGIRKLYLRYTVKWIEWDDEIVPVKIYIFDVTESTKRRNSLSDENAPTSCKIEYQVNPCDRVGDTNGECVDIKKARSVIPHGGDIIYGVAHQHSGGIGSALYGQDGRVLCTSMPTYGEGEEAGNEAGYIVGMSTCYPKPGSVKVADGELLTLESNYSSTQMHTGVMGLFYILVAEPQEPQTKTDIFRGLPISWRTGFEKYWWGFILACGIVAIIIGVSYSRRNNAEGYQSLAN